MQAAAGDRVRSPVSADAYRKEVRHVAGRDPLSVERFDHQLWRRLVPKRIDRWSVQQRLVKTGGRLVKHARCYCSGLDGQ